MPSGYLTTMENELNDLGKEGWQLVSTALEHVQDRNGGEPSQYVLFMRRELQTK